jgi:hypothetical protein
VILRDFVVLQKRICMREIHAWFCFRLFVYNGHKKHLLLLLLL